MGRKSIVLFSLILAFIYLYLLPYYASFFIPVGSEKMKAWIGYMNLVIAFIAISSLVTFDKRTRNPLYRRKRYEEKELGFLSLLFMSIFVAIAISLLTIVLIAFGGILVALVVLFFILIIAIAFEVQ